MKVFNDECHCCDFNIPPYGCVEHDCQIYINHEIRLKEMEEKPKSETGFVFD